MSFQIEIIRKEGSISDMNVEVLTILYAPLHPGALIVVMSCDEKHTLLFPSLVLDGLHSVIKFTLRCNVAALYNT